MAINLLTLDDAKIVSILNDPRIVTILPCLSGPKSKLQDLEPGGKFCQLCDAKKGGVKTAAMASARQCILQVRGDKLKELKTLLNARQLRIYVRQANNKKMIYTL